MRKAFTRTIIAALVACLLLPLSLLPLPASASPVGEAIKTAADFYSMSQDGSYYLDGDITLSLSYPRIFSGSLDGNGHTLTLSGGRAAFASLEGATVSNILLRSSYSSAVSTDIAALAMKGNGSFENVSAEVELEILDSANSFKNALGGLIAEVNGASVFENCSVSGRLRVSASPANGTGIATAVGAIAARVSNAGEVVFRSCVNGASVESEQTQMSVGGIVGIVRKDSQVIFENCVNNREITAKGGNHSGGGGICGTADGTHTPSASVSFIDCVNIGDVSENTDLSLRGNLHIGGILGRAYGMANLNFDGCFNSGRILSGGVGWASSGGIAGGIMTYGFAWSGTHGGEVGVNNCANVGSISGGNFSGGIIGGALQFNTDECMLSVERSANYGDVSGSNSGGIIGHCGESGFNGLLVKECYNGGCISASNSCAGIVGSVNTASDGDEYAISKDKGRIIDGCINSGGMRDAVMSSGILGEVTTQRVTLRSCVNTAKGSEMLCAISAANAKNITATGNFYLDEGRTQSYGIATSESYLREKESALLEKIPADTSELVRLLGYVGEYTADGYSHGWEELLKAREDAEALAYGICSLEEAESALAALWQSLEGLEFTQETDNSSLLALIESAQDCMERRDEYTSPSFEKFENAYLDAIYGRYSADAQYLEGLRASLSDAMALLERKGDVEPLYAELIKYVDYRQEEFTSCGWGDFHAALSAALLLIDCGEPSEKAISSAIAELSAAAARLEIRADAGVLLEKLDGLLAKYPPDSYTSSSYKAFSDALAELREAAIGNDLSQDSIDEMLASADELAGKLEERGDASELDAYIAPLGAYKQSDFQPEGWAALVSALERIEEARADADDLSKGEVEALTEELLTAIDALEPVADKDGGSASDGDSTDAPDVKPSDGPTETPGERPSESAENTETPEKSPDGATDGKGCGGSVGINALALCLALLASLGMRLKRD